MRSSTALSLLGRVAEALLVAAASYLIVLYAGQWVRDILWELCLTSWLFLVYVHVMFRSRWPRLILPVSIISLGLLGARMFMGTVPPRLYPWIVVGYLVTAFTLYHSVSRIISIILGERSSRFKTSIEDMSLDMLLFIISISVMTIYLQWLHAVRTPYGYLLAAATASAYVFTHFYLNRLVLSRMLTATGIKLGFAHPREPEAERILLSIGSLITLVSLSIPLVFAYTTPSLARRAFVPMALLFIYEGLVLLLYIVAYLIGIHGAFIEELVGRGERLVRVETYDVFRKWRDIGWFLSRGAGYFYRLKYLSALYMHYQGLEILSRRINRRELYYADLDTVLREGHRYIVEKGLSRLVPMSIVRGVIEVFTSNRITVVEPDTSRLAGEDEQVREAFRVAVSGVINLYAKLVEVPREARAQAPKLLGHAVEKLEAVKRMARTREAREAISGYIATLRHMIETGEYRRELLEALLVKKKLTLNMVRNYLVHGQLYKNAILLDGSRVLFDRFMSRPATLYTLYTHILAYTVMKAPELLEEK